MSMTAAEAIKQLDGANAMLFNRNMVAFNKAIIMAIKALQEQAEREDPKPLTIEELRQMNGEPAWVAELNYFAIVEVLDSGMWAGVPFVHTSIDGVRYVWNAESRNLHCYRHKPKEEVQ